MSHALKDIIFTCFIVDSLTIYCKSGGDCDLGSCDAILSWCWDKDFSKEKSDILQSAPLL